MWTELAYAIALTDYWLRIRRASSATSKVALITLIAVLEGRQAPPSDRADDERSARGVGDKVNSCERSERTA